MKVIDKKTRKDVAGKFYIKVSSGEVYEYTYSPVAGHFDADPKQLYLRKDLQLKVIDSKEIEDE